MFQKSLSTILSGFNKTLAELEDLMTRNNAKVASNDEHVSRLNKESAALSEETTRAAAVSFKIRSLIEG